MMQYKEKATSQLLLNTNNDWKNELANLEKTFEDFYLIKYKLETKGFCNYHKFTFTHTVYINQL